MSHSSIGSLLSSIISIVGVEARDYIRDRIGFIMEFIIIIFVCANEK